MELQFRPNLHTNQTVDYINILIYLLIAVGLSPGGSTHLHTNNTQNNTNNNRTTQITNNVEKCGPCPVFASFTLEIALKLRKMHGKTSVRVRQISVRLLKTAVSVQYTYYQNTHTNTHTLQDLHRVTYTRCRVNTIDYPDDGYRGVRNMQRIGINIYDKKNCPSSQLFIRTEPRCTVNRTYKTSLNLPLVLYGCGTRYLTLRQDTIVYVFNPQATNVIYIYIYIYIYMEHLFLMFLDHTQRRSTVGRTPLDE